jgi:hypothetical protein
MSSGLGREMVSRRNVLRAYGNVSSLCLKPSSLSLTVLATHSKATLDAVYHQGTGPEATTVQRTAHASEIIKKENKVQNKSKPHVHHFRSWQTSLISCLWHFTLLTLAFIPCTARSCWRHPLCQGRRLPGRSAHAYWVVVYRHRCLKSPE